MSLIINGKTVETNQLAPTPDIYEYIQYNDICQMEWYYEFITGQKFWIRKNKDSKYFRIVVFVPGFGTDEIIFRDKDREAEIFAFSWGTAGTIARHRINEIEAQLREARKPKPRKNPEAVQLSFNF